MPAPISNSIDARNLSCALTNKLAGTEVLFDCWIEGGSQSWFNYLEDLG
jgi:hypothetical protein